MENVSRASRKQGCKATNSRGEPCGSTSVDSSGYCAAHRAGSATMRELGRKGHLNLHNWRRDEWKPALKAAGLEYRRPYAMRHTFASFGIAAGIPVFELARMMGTSVEMIDKTYGHLLRDAASRATAALDAFDSRTAEEALAR
jgi:integrase